MSREASQLERLLSNLLDNAVEAVRDEGQVTVTTALVKGMIELTVKDTGRGIPADVLPRLGQKRATFGKAEGSGLGLYHAKSCVESWGGSLQVDSKLGEGTTVRLRLPAAAAPASIHSARTRPDGILVDDDGLMREVWGQAADAHGKTLKAFASSEEFLAVADGFDRASPVYLDSRLGTARRGEAVAKDLHARGFTNISLVTGRPADAYGEMPWVRTIRGKSPPWT